MSEPTKSRDVLVTTDGGVMVITINRPVAKNAITLSVAEGIAVALDELDARDDLAAGVVTGAGGIFCAGMDLKGFLSGELPFVDGRGFAGITERSANKPLIAAVEGYALAGGCEIALACDLIVAGRGAHFGIPEVKRGLIAAAGGLMRLPERIPQNIAMELALTGEFLRADRAHAIGLVNRIAEDGGALDDFIKPRRPLSRTDRLPSGPASKSLWSRVIGPSRNAGSGSSRSWTSSSFLTTPRRALPPSRRSDRRCGRTCDLPQTARTVLSGRSNRVIRGRYAGSRHRRHSPFTDQPGRQGLA